MPCVAIQKFTHSTGWMIATGPLPPAAAIMVGFIVAFGAVVEYGVTEVPRGSAVAVAGYAPDGLATLLPPVLAFTRWV